MPSDTVPGRLNGFSKPFSAAQIAAWVALACTSSEFLIINSPIMPLVASIIVTVVYFVVVGLVIFYGGQAQIVDPIDPFLQSYLQDTRPPTTSKLYRYFNPLNPPLPDEEVDESTLKQCWLCDTQVKTKSMHCKFCSKCIEEFDHHCMWLNTCIGKRNYHLFYRTLLALSVMLSMHFIISVALFSSSFNGVWNTRLRIMEAWSDSTGSSSIAAIRAIMIIFMLFDIGALFLIGQLIWFHLELQRKGLSTYEYIVRDMETKRDRARGQAEQTRQRVRQVNKAKQEGRGVYATRLVIGGYCRTKWGCASCDPLEVSKGGGAGGSADQQFALALGSGHDVDNDDKSIEPETGNQIEYNGDAEPQERDCGVTFVKVEAADEAASRVPQQEQGRVDGQQERIQAAQEQPDVGMADTSFQSHGSAEQPSLQNSSKISSDDDDAPSDEDW